MAGGKAGLGAALSKWFAKNSGNAGKKAQHIAADLIVGGSKAGAYGAVAGEQAAKVAAKHPGKTAALAGGAGYAAGKMSDDDDDDKKKKKKSRKYLED